MTTGKRYMLVEGTDAKVHLIYHTGRDRGSAQPRETRGERFRSHRETIRKKETRLARNDLGDANALLQNSSLLQQRSGALIRRGIHDVQPVWGGWLGQYQDEATN